MVAQHGKDVLKCVTTMLGVLFVMTGLEQLMHGLPADNLDFLIPVGDHSMHVVSF